MNRGSLRRFVLDFLMVNKRCYDTVSDSATSVMVFAYYPFTCFMVILHIKGYRKFHREVPQLIRSITAILNSSSAHALITRHTIPIVRNGNIDQTLEFIMQCVLNKKKKRFGDI